jgi:hypothetical protein
MASYSIPWQMIVGASAKIVESE